MKRLTIIVVILSSFAALCLGRYDSRASQLKIVQLPEPKLTGSLTLEQALAGRRSVRSFTARELNFTQLGQLAWAGQGITEKQRGFRTAPSAGAIYPIQLYFATSEGLFVYEPDKHCLSEVLNQDVRSTLATAASGQPWLAQAACDIIITGSVKKLAAKYTNRAKSYMLLEAGHIAQNILLQAVGLKLGAVPVGAFDINQVRKICKLSMVLEPVYIISLGYPAEQPATEKSEEAKTDEAKIERMTRAVLIVVAENFRDEELFDTQDVLSEAGVETVVASTETGLARGVLGNKVEATTLLKDVSVGDYDAVVFIGGPGAKQYFDDETALNIARQARQQGKVLAAICIAPAILANAGVLDGVRATSFSSERIRLKKAGATYTGSPVERDGLIVTATGPEAAIKFGETIVETLRKSTGL